MKIKKKYLIPLFFLIAIPSQSQLVTSIKDYVDAQIGIENSYLFNGKTYSNNYRVLSKKNQFLNENISYSKGNITTQQITFKNLELQYDLFSQELIIKPDSETSLFGIIVDTTKLDRFELDNMVFINIKNQKEFNGFYELASDKSNFKLFIKHKKTKRKLLDKKTIHYEFDNKYEYVLHDNQNFRTINSKKECLQILPDSKKEIKNFYSKNNYTYKTNQREFMKRLVDYLNTLKDSRNEK